MHATSVVSSTFWGPPPPPAMDILCYVPLAGIYLRKQGGTEEHAFSDASRDYLKRGWPHFGGDQERGKGGEEGKLLLWSGVRGTLHCGRGREGWKNLKLHRLSEEWTSRGEARRGRRMLSTTFSDAVASYARGGPTPSCGNP